MPFDYNEEDDDKEALVMLKDFLNFGDYGDDDIENRRLLLYGSIDDIDSKTEEDAEISKTGKICKQILRYNREDKGKPEEEREPIFLFINSPGGDYTEGFPLIDIIELSKTPVYTVNMGQWSSMAFLIGITGHKRFALPHATFLMHDGVSGGFGTSKKIQDAIKFLGRLDEKVKVHVLKHSNMTKEQYEAIERVEVYLLSEEALARGFIDEIVADLDVIL